MLRPAYIGYILGLVICLNLSISCYCHSQEYQISAEDVLKITFIEKPELNKTTTVESNGNISLPLIGRLQAAGLTKDGLARKIIDELKIYKVYITEVSVEIVAFVSNKIYVIGHVANPGKYSFEKIPDLWKVISEAGGPTEIANLSNVLVIRTAEEEGTPIIVNLAELLQQGDLSSLPKLKPGDTIYVSGTFGESGSPSFEALLEQRHVIYIYGEIANAGIYNFDHHVNLLQAIITAGGPTNEAKLNDVRIIRKGADNLSYTLKANIKWFAEDAKLDFFKLLPGDIVYIPRIKTWKQGFLGRIIDIAIMISITSLIYELLGVRRR